MKTDLTLNWRPLALYFCLSNVATTRLSSLFMLELSSITVGRLVKLQPCSNVSTRVSWFTLSSSVRPVNCLAATSRAQLFPTAFSPITTPAGYCLVIRRTKWLLEPDMNMAFTIWQGQNCPGLADSIKVDRLVVTSGWKETGSNLAGWPGLSDKLGYL